MFHLEILPELYECNKSKRSTLVLYSSNSRMSVQIIPQFLLQVQLLQFRGGTVVCHVLPLVSAGSLGRSFFGSAARLSRPLASRLSWDPMFTTDSMADDRRIQIFELLGRVLPVAALMTMFSEVAALWVIELDFCWSPREYCGPSLTGLSTGGGEPLRPLCFSVVPALGLLLQ